MTAQPQPPNQPNQPNLAQDQVFNRITTYVGGQIDAIATSMRLDKYELLNGIEAARQESLARDQELLNGIEAARQESLARDIELRNEQRAGFQALTDAVLRLTQGLQEVTQGLQALTQEVREGFAAQAERHNELMVRVERLERGNNQPPAEAE